MLENLIKWHFHAMGPIKCSNHIFGIERLFMFIVLEIPIIFAEPPIFNIDPGATDKIQLLVCFYCFTSRNIDRSSNHCLIRNPRLCTKLSQDWNWDRCSLVFCQERFDVRYLRLYSKCSSLHKESTSWEQFLQNRTILCLVCGSSIGHATVTGHLAALSQCLNATGSETAVSACFISLLARLIGRTPSENAIWHIAFA